MTSLGSILQDEQVIPKTMADALEWDDPAAALEALSEASAARAADLSSDLQEAVTKFSLQLPDLLHLKEDHPVTAATACADSILHSLTKIASGGSQASQEIRQLEDEKCALEMHAQAIELAIQFRQDSQRAAQSLQAESWASAADHVRPWLLWSQLDKTDARVEAYAGPYCLQQLQQTHASLKSQVLLKYKSAVQASDLAALGQLTPVLSQLQLAQQAVELYLQFLAAALQQTLPPAAASKTNEPPFSSMARVYNAAVQCLRHHLPMVSHFLHEAQGEVAVVQLVHVQCQNTVLPLIEKYSMAKQLDSVAQQASQIAGTLEDRYTGRHAMDGDHDDEDDAGFASHIGSLSDVDAAMEEAAVVIQHAESYLRFLQHTCQQVQQARQLRQVRAKEEARRQRARDEWTTGQQAINDDKDEEDDEYQVVEILPASTPLHQAVAELGGHYASIERCLLLASFQRAFGTSPEEPRYYRPLALQHAPKDALQTVTVETCMFATRHSTQRAFATGHTGTASAMTNFAVDCLQGVLLEVLSYRADDVGVSLLKPGEGLLVGSAGIFNNASKLATHVGTAVVAGSTHVHPQRDEVRREQERQYDVARACAVLNDLEVAVHHTRQLEALLSDAIAKGFPPDQHETEQLQMCVKSLSTVTDSFRTASDSTIESLVSVLKPRIRSIVGEAIGGEGGASATSAFMGSTVMGGKAGEKVMIRMNYNLDEDAYHLRQLSEGYVAHVCTSLDELLEPVRLHLSPRLWDTLLLGVMGAVCKRLETSLRKCRFTNLGALTLDSDMRDLLSYTKDRLHSTDMHSSNVTKICSPLGRLLQVSKLVNVDDLEDVIDLIGSSKRKGNWDLKLDDAKAYLSLRVEFEESKVNELLRLPDDS